MNKPEANVILNLLVADAQLSQTARDEIEKHYNTLTNYLSNNSTFDSTTYVQGSVNLGTSIKPITGGTDDYDVDFAVVIPHNSDDNAEVIKTEIGSVLHNSDRYNERLEEKKRAWRINYSQSHVDIVPAKAETSEAEGTIKVTKKNDTNYTFILSAPEPFAKWFHSKETMDTDTLFSKSIAHREVNEIKDFPKQTRGSILSRTVQLLKLHRDYMFKDNDQDLKPISMIITILAAKSYQSETNLIDSLQGFFTRVMYQFSEDNEGHLLLENPVLSTENFTDKWSEYPERKEAFFNWIKQAKEDIMFYDTLSQKDYLEKISQKFTNNGENVAKSYGQYFQSIQKSGNFSYNTSNGFHVKEQGEKKIPKNTFYGM